MPSTSSDAPRSAFPCVAAVPRPRERGAQRAAGVRRLIRRHRDEALPGEDTSRHASGHVGLPLDGQDVHRQTLARRWPDAGPSRLGAWTKRPKVPVRSLLVRFRLQGWRAPPAITCSACAAGVRGLAVRATLIRHAAADVRLLGRDMPYSVAPSSGNLAEAGVRSPTRALPRCSRYCLKHSPQNFSLVFGYSLADFLILERKQK
jgi:hypothetical protein